MIPIYIPWKYQKTFGFLVFTGVINRDIVRIWSHLLKKFLMENFIFYAVSWTFFNPFYANFPFLYPLKVLENQRFSDSFRGCRNKTLMWNELSASIVDSGYNSIIILIIFQLKRDTQRRIYPVKTKMECFCKNSWRLKAVNYFRKMLHFRCFLGFWICLWHWNKFQSVRYLY